jgi:hypothetical protein
MIRFEIIQKMRPNYCDATIETELEAGLRKKAHFYDGF